MVHGEHANGISREFTRVKVIHGDDIRRLTIPGEVPLWGELEATLLSPFGFTEEQEPSIHYIDGTDRITIASREDFCAAVPAGGELQLELTTNGIAAPSSPVADSSAEASQQQANASLVPPPLLGDQGTQPQHRLPPVDVAPPSPESPSATGQSSTPLAMCIGDEVLYKKTGEIVVVEEDLMDGNFMIRLPTGKVKKTKRKYLEKTGEPGHSRGSNHSPLNPPPTMGSYQHGTPDRPFPEGTSQSPAEEGGGVLDQPRPNRGGREGAVGVIGSEDEMQGSGIGTAEEHLAQGGGLPIGAIEEHDAPHLDREHHVVTVAGGAEREMDEVAPAEMAPGQTLPVTMGEITSNEFTRCAACLVRDLVEGAPLIDFLHEDDTAVTIVTLLRHGLLSNVFRCCSVLMIANAVVQFWDEQPFLCTPNAIEATVCKSTPQKMVIILMEIMVYCPLLLIHLCLRARSMGREKFLKDQLQVSHAVLVVYYVACVIGELCVADRQNWTPWYMRVWVRPWLLVVHFGPLQVCLHLLTKSCRGASYMLLFLLLVVTSFVVAGVSLFQAEELNGGSQYFLESNCIENGGGGCFNNIYQAYSTIVWWMLTETSPDSGNSGYGVSKYWSLYWTAVTVVLIFGFVSMLMTVVYAAYTEARDKYETWRTEMYADRLSMCFVKLIKAQAGERATQDEQVKEATMGISPAVFCSMYLDMYTERERTQALVAANELLKMPGVVQGEMLGFSLDSLTLLLTEFEVVYEPPPALCPMVLKVSNAEWFRKVAHVFIFIGAIIATFDVMVEIEAGAWKPEWLTRACHWIMAAGIIFSDCDAVLTIIGMGPQMMLSPRGETLRHIPRVLLWVLQWTSILYLHASTGLRLYGQEMCRLMSVFYQLRLLRLAVEIKGFRRIIDALNLVIPRLTSLVLLLFGFIYSWAAWGMWLWGGEIVKGNANLAAMDSIAGVYYSMNFNTLQAGLYTLLMCMVGNNMPNFLLTYQAVGGKVNARLYFWTFYLSMQWLVLNVVISVFLDAFMEAYGNPLLGADTAPAEQKDEIVASSTDQNGRWVRAKRKGET